MWNKFEIYKYHGRGLIIPDNVFNRWGKRVLGWRPRFDKHYYVIVLRYTTFTYAIADQEVLGSYPGSDQKCFQILRHSSLKCGLHYHTGQTGRYRACIKFSVLQWYSDSYSLFRLLRPPRDGGYTQFINYSINLLIVACYSILIKK